MSHDGDLTPPSFYSAPKLNKSLPSASSISVCLRVKVVSHVLKIFSFFSVYGRTLRRDVFMVVCRVFCVKLGGATSSKGSLSVFCDRVYPPTACVGRFLQSRFSGLTGGANRHKLITSFTRTEVDTTSFKATRPQKLSHLVTTGLLGVIRHF